MMPGPDAPVRPATLIVAVVVLVFTAIGHLGRLGGPLLFGWEVIPDAPLLWRGIGVALALAVGIGGLVAAVGMLQGRARSWYVGVGVAGLVVGVAIVSGVLFEVLEAKRRASVSVLFAGVPQAVAGAVAAILLAARESRTYCGVET